MTRPRLARLQQIARDVAEGIRRRPRPRPEPGPPDQRTGDELARRLDATRERLRREIPPGEERPPDS